MASESKRHPFLDDLAENVTLTSSILREPVVGRALVMKVVKSTGRHYLEQRSQFLGNIEGRTFLVYEADLVDGGKAVGLVCALRNGSGEVTDLNISFSPLGAVLTLAAALKADLSEELGSSLFL